MAKFQFRLLAGQHVQNDLSVKPRVFTDPTTGEKQEKYPDKTYNVGEIVESEYDLASKHGADKFERVNVPVPVHSSFPAPEGVRRPADFDENHPAAPTSPKDSVKDIAAKDVPKTPPVPAPVPVESHKPIVLPNNLNSLSLKLLQQYADDNEIDVEDAGNDRVKVIGLIRKAADDSRN